jgi:VIT1/CCC1 family predicted Fe2+/Mn2+ transporter
MDTAVWIVQILVALAFALSGIGKLTQPREKLLARMAWVEDFSANQIRLIGLAEALGAVGIILPAVTGILPILTPIAAVGLVLVMLGAVGTHLRRGETPVIAVNVVLAALAAFVAYGRFIAVPLA